ncbi:AbrB/MazE/SpoVT family DNA-binding domain-containing protein [Thermodesulfobacteriota bacterium]
MLAKLTSKNQITIPNDVLSKFPHEISYFDVEYQEGIVILKPLKLYETDLAGIRSKIKNLGLSEDCVGEAIRWVRSTDPDRSSTDI